MMPELPVSLSWAACESTVGLTGAIALGHIVEGAWQFSAFRLKWLTRLTRRPRMALVASSLAVCSAAPLVEVAAIVAIGRFKIIPSLALALRYCI